MITFEQLQVNLKDNPIDVGKGMLRFSWRYTSDETDVWQQSCHITVRETATGRALWDSGVRQTARAETLWDGAGLSSDTAYTWTLRCEVSSSSGTSELSASANFETALFDASDWHGCWLGETKEKEHHIYRRAFTVRGEPVSAKLYLCGLGHAEGWLNGARVTDSVLEPGWTDYRKSCQYVAYDVSHLIRRGDNALGLWLGDGMFNATKEGYVYFERSFGLPRFIAQLNITCADGSREEIVSDENWTCAVSPLLYSGIYGGEDYDARLEQDGFSKPDFKMAFSGAASEAQQASSAKPLWTQAVSVQPPEGTLVPQSQEPLKVGEVLKPVGVWKTDADSYVYDLGVNFSGWVAIRIRLPKAEKRETDTCNEIHMTPSEILGDDRRPLQKLAKGYHWRYILSDEERQEYRPRFTYFGFR